MKISNDELARIDSRLLGGRVRKARTLGRTLVAKSQMKRQVDSFHVNLRVRHSSVLEALCEEHGSDKGSPRNAPGRHGWRPHTYTQVYSDLFDHCRSTVRNVFECGIGTNNPSITSTMGVRGVPGASLRVWREYFPNASIFGADIDSTVLFEENRIQTFYVDQTSPDSVENLLSCLGWREFDVIVDDGLHEFHAGVTLFESMEKVLAPTGLYIIEDVVLGDLDRYFDYFVDKPSFSVNILMLERSGVSLGDNSMVVIRKVYPNGV
jgi:hypothetical protein